MTCHQDWIERTGVPESFTFLAASLRLSWGLLTSVSSESEGDGDESFEEAGGVPSRVGWVCQLPAKLSRSTCGEAVPSEGGPRGGHEIGLGQFLLWSTWADDH